MQIRFADACPTGDFALVLPAAGDLVPGLDSLGAARAGVEAALKRSRFEGDANDVVEYFLDSDGDRRLLVIGAGSDPASGDAPEKLGGNVVARLLASGETHAVINLSGLKFDADAAARVGLSAALRAWRYDRYRTRLKEKQKATLATVTIVGAGQAAEERYVTRYAAVAQGVALARELVTEPPNIIYPESFVERVTESVKDLGLEIQVLDRSEMEKLGMGALLGVAQGSVREARMLVLKWKGGKAGDAPIAFVGKGVTFDTGGISIKPAQNMEAMKCDMGGAAAVAGAMKAIAGRKARANVIGICGLVENMPDANAQRPGDVVTTMSGQTVEVINTDAEGRLVLCDAMTWTQRTFKPKAMIDLATLTGAIVITLGHEYAGMFASHDGLAADLVQAANETGDKLWRLPMGEAYDRLIDSPIADMKNVGSRGAGSITAAQFLKRYVEDDMPWAHLDIAGMAWTDHGRPTCAKGATGFGVRLLDQYIAGAVES